MVLFHVHSQSTIGKVVLDTAGIKAQPSLYILSFLQVLVLLVLEYKHSVRYYYCYCFAIKSAVSKSGPKIFFYIL